MKSRIKRLDNKGSALLTVVLVVTFLTILATILLYITGMNFQIKQADYQNKKNFYKGEEALEMVRARLMADVSEAAVLANQDMMCNYSSMGSEDLRVNQYNVYFTEHLQEIWDAKLVTRGSWDNLLNHYMDLSDASDYTLTMDLDTYDANHNGSLSSDEALEITEHQGMIIIHGIELKYINPDNKLATKISTDFRITAPELDWSAYGTKMALDEGVSAEAAGTKEMVNPCDSVVYTEWKKE